MYWRIQAKWSGKVLECTKCPDWKLPAKLGHQSGKGLDGMVLGYVEGNNEKQAMDKLLDYMIEHSDEM